MIVEFVRYLKMVLETSIIVREFVVIRKLMVVFV